MAAPALCTGCSGWFSRMVRLFQVIQAFQEFPHCSQWIRKVSEQSGHNWMQLDITGRVWMSGRHVWMVPEHLVLGMCWLASPVGTRSA